MTQQVPGPAEARPVAGEGQSSGVRSVGSRPCPACGVPVNVNASVCPSCGESLPQRNKKIRCRRCHGTASSSLVICPHCGRELQAAPPRLLTWGIPVLLVLLFGTVLLTRMGGANPVSWTQARVARAVAFVGGLGDRLQPEITIETIPVEEALEDQLVRAPAPTQPAPADSNTSGAATGDAAGDATVVAEVPPTETPTATSQPTATALPPTPTTAPELPTATATATSVPATATPLPATATPLPATATTTVTLVLRATAVPTATTRSSALAVASSATVTATASSTPTVAVALLALPTPTPTLTVPTPTPQLYTVRVGDTLFEIALDRDISLDLLLAANALTADDVYTIQPGDTLIIPDPNATPAATATPEPSATPTPSAGSTYTVRAGDTLMAIALRNGINTQALLDANGLTLAEARTLRPGQELIIPGSAGLTTATPAATTAAAAPPATGATAGLRLDAPVLRTPENSTVVSCGKTESLVWNAVPFIQAGDLYLVHLGYLNSPPGAGAEEIIWVLEQQRPSATTSWELDESLCGLAPFDFGRQWRWYVEVVERATDGKLNPVSAPSPVWGFSWQ